MLARYAYSTPISNRWTRLKQCSPQFWTVKLIRKMFFFSKQYYSKTVFCVKIYRDLSRFCQESFLPCPDKVLSRFFQNNPKNLWPIKIFAICFKLCKNYQDLAWHGKLYQISLHWVSYLKSSVNASSVCI